MVLGIRTLAVDALDPVICMVGPPLIELVSTSDRCWVGLCSGDFGGRVNNLSSLSCSLGVKSFCCLAGWGLY